MAKTKKKQKEIKIEDIKDDSVDKYEDMYRRAKSIHVLRTKNHEFYSKVAHMENLYDEEEVIVSEGSTQAIERKLRAQTIQRVPDGELITQFDKDDICHVQTEFIFKNKVLQSEFSGKDMYKNLWRTFDNAYIYGFGCVRTGFERDQFGDIRISYKQIPYDMVLPNPDCDYIEEADWYIVNEMLSRAEIEGLFDENDKLIDKTWNEDALRYVVQHKHHDGEDSDSKNRLADNEKGVTKIESIKVRTLYKKGASEFVTYSPTLNATIRTVKNEDPRKDVPLHFMILEPDPEFPLGVSSVMWTLSQQQFIDAFQSTVYNTLLLSANPPLMGFGDLAETDIFMEPGAYWAMGTNPNNKIEKFPTETTTITQYGSILEQTAGAMARNMNASDGTIASDAHVTSYSKTAPGVEAQQADKTITVNQYQKRVEIFFSEWANHALRSYIASMKGKQMLTVDEETRRKIFDIEDAQKDDATQKAPKSIIDGDKIEIDFDKLSSDMLEFRVRTGSLIQSRQEEERQNIQELLVPITQSLGALTDDSKPAVEQNILQMLERMFELTDIDFSATASKRIDNKLVIDAIKAAYVQIIEQAKAISQLEQAIANGGQEQPQQPEQQGGQPQQQVPQQAAPAPQQVPPEQAQ